MLRRHIERESLVIAQLQRNTPSAVLTASKHLAVFGTHEAFLLVLPALFFYPGDSGTDLAMALAAVLMLGVVLSAVVKDYSGLPRPLKSAGVFRISTHKATELEYGFPSTHSTNAASVGIILASVTGSNLWLLYPLCMGYSRIATGMHSFLDVVGGWILGIFLSCAWIASYPILQSVLEEGGLLVLSFVCIIPLLLAYHPDPEDECPCFNDSVACISVFGGMLIAYWLRFGKYWGNDNGLLVNFSRNMSSSHVFSAIEGSYSQSVLITRLMLRLTFGIFIIYLFKNNTKFLTTAALEKFRPSVQSESKLDSKLHYEADKNDTDLSMKSVQVASSNDGTTKKYRIPRFTNKMLVDCAVYFGIAVVAIYILPLCFLLVGI